MSYWRARIELAGLLLQRTRQFGKVAEHMTIVIE